MFKVLRKIAEILVKGSICVGHFIPKIYGTNCNVVLTGAVYPPSLKKMSRSGAIFVGRLEQDTGLMEYIRALHILKDAHGITLPFTICGAGAFEAEAMRLAESLGIDVKFKGVIPEPWKLINSKQVCFAAGYLTILEAMSLGLPVIGIARSPLKAAYLKGVLKDGGPISIQTTPEGVAREIARIINDPHLAARIAEQGKRFASKMSWNRMTIAYLDLWT
jgi:glycosyltransferase involved in cell wall biosynthesis